MRDLRLTPLGFRVHRVFAEGVPIISKLLAIVCQPCLRVFNNADQIEPEEKMGRRSAGSVAQVMDDLFHGIRSFAPAS